LGEHFSQDELLGEVLGGDDDAIRMSVATCNWKKKQRDEKQKDRLTVSGQMANLNHEGHYVSRRKPRWPETFVILRAPGGSCFSVE
jgi:hypothetical protein